MSKIIKVIAATVFIWGAAAQVASANLVSAPLSLKGAVVRIKFDKPTLAPMSYTIFCLRYAEDCQIRKTFRGGAVKLTSERWLQLKDVNVRVNSAIQPEVNSGGLATESWLISPARGDCNDYAVTKRHELLRMGWPPRTVLLGEVITNSGEHHLVLVVRTAAGDLVLDNMTGEIKPWSRTPYKWVRIQSPHDAKLWSSLAVGGSV